MVEDDKLKDLDSSPDDDDTEIAGKTNAVAEASLASNLEPMDGNTSEEIGFVDVDLSGKEPTVARVVPKADEQDSAGKAEDTGKAGDADESGDADEAGDVAYSVKVRQRIGRERRLKEEERRARIVAEKEATDTKRELAKLKAEKETSAIDVEIDDLKGKIKTAKHALDHDEEVELTDKLQKANMRRVTAEKVAVEEKPEIKKPQADDEEPELHALAKQWYKRNDWMYDVRNREQHDEAVAVNGELLKEGVVKPQTQDFYDELDRRLTERLEEKKLNVPKKNSEAKASPVAGVETAPVRTSKKSVRLNADDFSMMRRVGLNPENKAHLIEYARNKAKSSASV